MDVSGDAQDPPSRTWIMQTKERLIQQDGPWTAHDILLADGIHTLDRDHSGYQAHVRRIVQIVADLHQKPMGSMRVLDLGCLEGGYAIEFAQRGATVVGVEGRRANADKARFAKEALSLSRLEIIADDVRHLTADEYGQFDIVLCLGILYHLNAPDVFLFIERMAEVCRGIAIIDTHVSLTPSDRESHRGKTYFGKNVGEFSDSDTQEAKDRALWSALDNAKSFWFSRPSLYNILTHVGFTSVYECFSPSYSGQFDNRPTLVAVKGANQTVVSIGENGGVGVDDWSERRLRSWRRQSSFPTLRRLLPAPVKRLAKRLLPSTPLRQESSAAAGRVASGLDAAPKDSQT
jgi:SAM-dependent methyltransferase